MSLEEKIPPLPTGEHPWARELRFTRKLASGAELLLTIFITFLLLGTASFRLASYFDSGPFWLKALLFSGALSLIYGLALLPLSFTRGYLIEKRFGLSTQTALGWIADQLKGVLVGAVLGSVVVTGLTLALTLTGRYWWWTAALGATIFGIILTRLAPQLILPLFFKLKPLESEELQKRFKALAERTATPVLGVYEIDLSRRTKAANAAVIGFGDTRKAVVGDTLLSEFSLDEVEFVLAHELGHHRYHDLWSGVALSGVGMFISLWIAHVALGSVAWRFNVPFPPDAETFNPILLFWISIALSISQAVLGPLTRLFSRFVETRADRFAAQSTGNPTAGATAFKKLGFQNMAVFRPPLWEELLFYTHPAISRRINMLEKETPPAPKSS